MFKKMQARAILLFPVLTVLIAAGCGGGSESADETLEPPVTEAPLPDYYVSIEGGVVPPSGVDAQALRIVTYGRSYPVANSGGYSSSTRGDTVSLVIASLERVSNFSLATIVVPPVDSSVKIDTTSTAVALVFLSPLLVSQDPDTASAILELISEDPSLPNLAQAIDDVFLELDPFRDPRFASAYAETLDSVLSRYAQFAASNLIAETQVAKSNSAYLRLPKRTDGATTGNLIAGGGSGPEQIYSIDTEYTSLDVTDQGDTYILTPTTTTFSLVDWLVEASLIDSDVLRYTHEFESALSDPFFIYPRDTSAGSPFGLEIAEAHGFFRWFSPSTVFGGVKDFVRGFTAPEGLRISSAEDAIYVLRYFSGGIAGNIGDDGAERDFVRNSLPGGRENHHRARLINEIAAATSLLGAFLDVAPLVDAEVGEQCLADAVLAVFSANIDSVVISDSTHNQVLSARDTMVILNEEFASCLVVEGLVDQITAAALVGELWETVSMPLEALAGAGEVFERFSFLTLFATPLETLVIQVGTPIVDDLSPPTTPVNVVATGTSPSEIRVEWGESTDNDAVAEYLVYRNNELVRRTSGLVFVDTGLTLGTTYCYEIQALDFAGNLSFMSSPSSCGTTLMEIDRTPPTIPGSLRFTILSANRIDIEWVDSVDNVGIEEYRVYRYETLLGEVFESAYSDLSVEPSTDYCYAVSAVDWNGNVSDRSAFLCTTGIELQDAQEGWQSFVNGDPGIPNDGSYVIGDECPAASGCTYSEFVPSDRIKLGPDNSPITISVYPARFGFSLRMRFAGYPPYCSSSFGSSRTDRDAPPYDGVEGKFVVIDAATFAAAADVARNRYAECQSAPIESAYINQLDISTAGNPVDGVYLGFGVEEFPDDGLPPIPQDEGWVSFEQGEAGVPDDGILVLGDPPCSGCEPQHTIVEEFVMGDADGLTISVYGTEGEALDDIIVRYSGFPEVCSFNIPLAGALPNAPTIRGVLGKYLSLSRSQFSTNTTVVSILNPDQCGGVTDADAYYSAFELSGTLYLVDGVFIGVGQNVFPEG